MLTQNAFGPEPNLTSRTLPGDVGSPLNRDTNELRQKRKEIVVPTQAIA